MVKVFVSHAHADAALAAALKTLITTVFDEVDVDYSSDESAGGGIEIGANWLEWIIEKVGSCELAVVVVTPESLARPWLMWESGAVAGMALASGQRQQIAPLLFRVNSDSVAGPLRHLQAESGETEQGIHRLVDAIWVLLGRRPDHDRLDRRRRWPVQTYLEEVRAALQDRPQALDEGGIQEWCDRLDILRRRGMHSEVAHVHRALLLAVGREADDADRVPLDVRLHRRLGEVYLESGRGAEAVDQFTLALRLFPRDVFLLHKLALAHLECRNRGQAIATLERIDAIDSAASRANPEVAGLKGRLHREEWQQSGDRDHLRTARDAYQAALDQAPDSYYMAANVGELSLALDEGEAAAAAYDRAVAAIRRTGERSWWSLATLASAAVVKGDQAEALQFLGEAGALNPPPRDMESIRQGLLRLQQQMGTTADVSAGWMGALVGGQASSEVTPP
jgi:tetratricopeptide (TPR) repeat protein